MPQIQPKQIEPGSNGQVLLTSGGQTIWGAAPGGGGSGEFSGGFGDGADGDLTLVGNTAIPFQTDAVIRRYNNLSLAGFELQISAGQSLAIIYVNGVLDLGVNGKIVHLGNPYQNGGLISTDLTGLHVEMTGDPPREGGNGGAPGGTLLVYAREVTGSGSIEADGLVGQMGDNSSTSGGTNDGAAGADPLKPNPVLFGNSVNFSGNNGVTALPSASGTSVSSNPGGVAKDASNWGGGAPFYDSFADLYRIAYALLNASAGSAVTGPVGTYEPSSYLPGFFRGWGGQAGGGGGKAQVSVPTHRVVAGPGGGCGGGITRYGRGGNGGDGGAASGGVAGSTRTVASGGGGGGGGAGGLAMFRCAVNSTTSLAIRARGGAGAPGGSSSTAGGAGTGSCAVGGAGGGGGGGGGIGLYQGPSTVGTSIDVSGGLGGSGRTGEDEGSGAVGSPGTAGADGSTGLAFMCSY